MADARVARWADEFDEIRIEMGLSADRYPVALGLALTDVESDGDPEAHRDGSQFWGLLQQGRAAGIDTGFEDAGRNTTAALHGDVLLAIREWYEYMERYQHRWAYEGSGAPLISRAAVLWKGGAGTARKVRDKIRHEGWDFYQALSYYENHPNRDERIPRLTLYVRRAETAWGVWNAWVDQNYVPDGVTEVDTASCEPNGTALVQLIKGLIQPFLKV